MHSVNERRAAPRAGRALPILLVLLLVACGNYSNDDLTFLAAIPSKEQLHLTVPQASGQALCALGSADAAVNARTTGSSLNQAIEGILAFVDLIRAVPPTGRDGEQRSWGPWDDAGHPGVRYRVTMVRTLGATPAHDQYAYAFTGSRSGGAFLSVITGTFIGSEAQKGSGNLRLDFDAAWTLGTNKPTDPHGAISVAYDLSQDPHALELQLDTSLGALQPSYLYRWLGYADGRALFDFAITDPASGNRVVIDARFTGQGDGKASLTVTLPSGFSVSVDECFDGQACLSWLSDAFAVTPACNGVRPCLLGQASACPSGLP
jgi:hypothetical protein